MRRGRLMSRSAGVCEGVGKGLVSRQAHSSLSSDRLESRVKRLIGVKNLEQSIRYSASRRLTFNGKVEEVTRVQRIRVNSWRWTGRGWFGTVWTARTVQGAKLTE